MTTTVRVSTFSKGLPLLVALAGGFFESEGLKVEWTRTRGSREQIEAALDGRLDIIHTAVDNVMAYHDRGGRGTDLVVFFVGELAIEQALVVGPGINAFEDLRGRALGADAPDTGYAIVMRKILADHGLGEGDYSLVSVGGTIERLEAMRSRRVPACMLQEPVEDPSLRVLVRARDVFPKYPSLTAATTRTWGNSHENELQGYTQALVRGAKWAADPANTETAAGLLAEDQTVSLEEARNRVQAFTGQPNLRDMEEALLVVRRLRDDVVGGRPAGAPVELSRYWEPRFQARAMADVEASEIVT